MTRPYVFLLGGFLICWGVSTFFTPVVGFLTSSVAHGSIHIVFGLIGLYAAAAGNPRPFCIWVGTLMLTAGIFYFLPGLGEYMVAWFYMSKPVAFFNLGLGLLTLIMAGRERRVDRGEGKKV